MRSAPIPTDSSGGIPILRLEAVSKRYGSRLALDGITLDVADDSYVSLLGASGSGKTVLLRAIAGFEPLDGGTIALRGEPLNDRPAHRRNIGFVFQNFALFPHLTVQQNIAFGLENRAGDRPSPRMVAERVRAMVDLVGLSGLESRAVPAISGGPPSPARWWRSRPSCSSTSRSGRSTPTCAPACAASFAASGNGSG